MKTIAIDASTKSTGVAIFKDDKLERYHNIQDSNKNVLKRIKYMTDKIEEIYRTTKTRDGSDGKVQIIMEQIIPDNLNEAKWTHNQATFKALFYLQAAIVLMFDNYGIDVEFIGASSWRKICGIDQTKYANRDILKARDVAFVKEKFGLDVNDDIADAICIGWAKVNETPQPQAFNWEE